MRLWRQSDVLMLTTLSAGMLVGCAAGRVALPDGHLPAPTVSLDARTTAALLQTTSAEPEHQSQPVVTPVAHQTVTPVQTQSPTAATPPASSPALSLAEFLAMATANSPVLKQAAAEAEVAHGRVIQAGLHPNPTVGYQADQVQPGLRGAPGELVSGAGQQGAFVSQLIKTAGKLTLAQQVAGYDFINALVAVRRAQTDVTAAVRGAYFAVLVARQTAAANRALAATLDGLYRQQTKQVTAGVAAEYEPLQLYAQLAQVRTAVATAEATAAAAWKQLGAAVGRPDLPPAPLVGSADAPPPTIDRDELTARILDTHTDVLTARNAIAQARTDLTLQQRVPIPDVETNTYHQYDSLARTYQFGVQVGVPLPVSDKNQGNIRAAQAKVAVAGMQLEAARNALAGRLADAYGRYRANAVVAAGYRDDILPALTRASHDIVRRYQAEPEKVGFNDVVVAQLSLVQATQAHLAALDAQWKAVVEVAAIGQLDELYPEAEPPKK